MGWEQDLQMHLGGDYLRFHACSEVCLTEEGHLRLGEVRGVWVGQRVVCRVQGWS